MLPAAGKTSKKAPQHPPTYDKPTLILQASPRYGFLPLTVSLYARLEGVPPGDGRFCHAGVEWTGETGNGQVMRSTEDSRCLHAEGDTRVEHSYTKTVELTHEGVYRYRATLHLNDGKTLQSNTVDVRALSNY